LNGKKQGPLTRQLEDFLQNQEAEQATE
jgi:hypothetical protein